MYVVIKFCCCCWMWQTVILVCTIVKKNEVLEMPKNNINVWSLCTWVWVIIPYHKMFRQGTILCCICPLTHLHCIQSLNPILEVFFSNLAQMFTLTRQYAELMLPLCQLKVKVTLRFEIDMVLPWERALQNG